LNSLRKNTFAPDRRKLAWILSSKEILGMIGFTKTRD